MLAHRDSHHSKKMNQLDSKIEQMLKIMNGKRSSSQRDNGRDQGQRATYTGRVSAPSPQDHAPLYTTAPSHISSPLQALFYQFPFCSMNSDMPDPIPSIHSYRTLPILPYSTQQETKETMRARVKTFPYDEVRNNHSFSEVLKTCFSWKEWVQPFAEVHHHRRHHTATAVTAATTTFIAATVTLPPPSPRTKPATHTAHRLSQTMRTVESLSQTTPPLAQVLMLDYFNWDQHALSDEQVILAFCLGSSSMSTDEVLNSDIFAELLSDISMKMMREVLTQHARQPLPEPRSLSSRPVDPDQ